MNHDPVFEFSEHFNVKFLQSIFQNNISYARDIFRLFLKGTDERLQAVQQLLDAEDWDAANHRIHRFKPDFFMAGLSDIGRELERIEHALGRVGPAKTSSDPEVASILADFHRVHLEVLAMYPLVQAEIDRMNVYLSHPSRHL